MAHQHERRFRTLLLAVAAVLAGCAQLGVGPREGIGQIDHIVVIYAENRSFDHLYGLFPGADGIAQATAEQKTQIDHDGKPLATLPPVFERGKLSERHGSHPPPRR